MGCSFNTDLVSPTWSLMWCAMLSRDYSFNTDLVSTNLNSQRMRNRVRNLNFMSCSFNPAPFLPLWILRKYISTFHELLIQYWPPFNHFKVPGGVPCCSMSYSFNTDFILNTLNFQDLPCAIWRFIHWMFILFQLLCMTLFSIENLWHYFPLKIWMRRSEVV